MNPDDLFDRIKADARSRFPQDLFLQNAYAFGYLQAEYRNLLKQFNTLKESNHEYDHA